jgi:bifunctional polynucleotide phosphatase/kinase
MSFINWIEEKNSYMYSIDIPTDSTKLACFDMDGTLIKPKSGKKFPIDRDDWELLYYNTKEKIKELHNSNYAIIIFTNQMGVSKGKISVSDLKKKLEAIQSELDIPISFFASFATGYYRKPMTGIWDILSGYILTNRTELKDRGVIINIKDSYYCGDAAGRLKNWKKGFSKDFSNTDRLFAYNIKLKFYTPEEIFLGEIATKKYDNSYPIDLSNIEYKQFNDKSSTNITSDSQEIVITVGFPGCGKTTFAMNNFTNSNGYTRINMDLIKSKSKIKKMIITSLENGKSIIIDNTNSTKKTRKEYIDYSKKYKIPIRCYYFDSSLDFCNHMNHFRTQINKNDISLVPKVAYHVYNKKLEKPSKQEGFNEITTISFQPFFNNRKEYVQFLYHYDI